MLSSDNYRRPQDRPAGAILSFEEEVIDRLDRIEAKLDRLGKPRIGMGPG